MPVITKFQTAKKPFATTKHKFQNQYMLEVICVKCKRRGKLWFFDGYKFAAHTCPQCGQLGLRSPDWINKKKQNFIIY